MVTGPVNQLRRQRRLWEPFGCVADHAASCRRSITSSALVLSCRCSGRSLARALRRLRTIARLCIAGSGSTPIPAVATAHHVESAAHMQLALPASGSTRSANAELR